MIFSRAGSVAVLCAFAACSSEPSTQVITGHIDGAKGALAIRAVANGEVVTATPVRTDGTFTLAIPEGTHYRLEVLTRDGVKKIVARSGNRLADLTFSVCQPSDPFDAGEVGDPMSPPCTDPMDPTCNCQADGTCCAPGDPSCTPEPCNDPMAPNCMPPPPCDPMSDPDCKCDPSTGNCCAAGDPNCVPPPGCMDPMDPTCQPPPGCDPMTGDPDCKCDPATGTTTCEPPPPMCNPMTDPNCGPGCYADGTCPCSDPNEPGCAPPCDDPMDPTSCKDPCLSDPANCGCMAGDPSCWPDPEPCDANGMCDPGEGMSPANVPGDFGCNAP
ncbi:MAG: hypothetical protein ABI867_35550 [Kofleriaceae bacterium]